MWTKFHSILLLQSIVKYKVETEVVYSVTVGESSDMPYLHRFFLPFALNESEKRESEQKE